MSPTGRKEILGTFKSSCFLTVPKLNKETVGTR
jgi:hypothetical protein